MLQITTNYAGVARHIDSVALQLNIIEWLNKGPTQGRANQAAARPLFMDAGALTRSLPELELPRLNSPLKSRPKLEGVSDKETLQVWGASFPNPLIHRPIFKTPEPILDW